MNEYDFENTLARVQRERERRESERKERERERREREIGGWYRERVREGWRGRQRMGNGKWKDGIERWMRNMAVPQMPIGSVCLSLCVFALLLPLAAAAFGPLA